MATDNFENTDGTLLTTHNSDWTVTGSGASNCEINDNEVFVDNIWQVAYCTHSSTVDSCMIELTGKGSASANARIRPFIRGYSTGYRMDLGFSATHLTDAVYYRNNVWQEAINFTDVSRAGATVRIEGTIDGSNLDLELFINGASVWTDTDTSPVGSAGSPGFYLYCNGENKDNCRIEGWTDEGSFSAPAGAVPKPNLLNRQPYRHLLTR